jgi:hypothetical protein
MYYYWTIISGWFQDFFVPFLFRMMNDDEFLLDSDMLAKTAGAPFCRIASNSKAFGSQYLHAVGGGHSSGEISWALAHFGVLEVEHPTDFGNVKYQDPSGIYLEATHIYTIGIYWLEISMALTCFF